MTGVVINTHPGGRPLSYQPDELLDKFMEYKDAQKEQTKDVYDNKTKTVKTIEYDKPMTLTGFCVFADISRETLNEYKNNRKEFSDVIKKIYTECEGDLLTKALAFDQHAGFSEFILMNAHGYVKKQEIEHSGDLEIIVKKPE